MMKTRILLLITVIILLIGCSNIEQKKAETIKSSEDDAFSKCYKAFMSGNGTTPQGKDLPPYLKEQLAKEFCNRMLEESKKQLEEVQNSIWGVFANQGIILPKEGGTFDINVMNNGGAGDFTLELVKTPIPTMNDINYVLAEKSFHLEPWADKKISVSAKPTIRPDYKLPQEAFPLKIIAKKNGQPWKEIEIFVMADTA